jgi:hypothetical protein
MRSLRAITLAATLLPAFTIVLACDKKPSTDSTAASSSAGDSTLNPINYQKKPPGKGTHPVTQKAVKGGSGPTVPGPTSLRTPEPSTDRQMRKHARADLADCNVLPDNAAECDGASIYFCDDKKLWVVDCDAEAKFSGVKGGSCFEGEKFVDCLGCDTADDGTQACCDFEMTVCCNDAGDCWSPK